MSILNKVHSMRRKPQMTQSTQEPDTEIPGNPLG